MEDQKRYESMFSSKTGNQIMTAIDMVDSRYLNEELPDDFMYQRIGEMFKNDNIIKVMTETLSYQDTELSRVCMLDYRDNSIHVGPKYLKEPYYMPQEDFTAVDIELDYYEDYEKGIRREFPDAPMCVPIIPINEYAKIEINYAVEKMMGDNGAIICDPSIGAVEDMVNYNFCQYKHTYGLESVNEVELGDDSFLFMPYKDFAIEDMVFNDKRIIAMQFNPFHPMAMRMLTTMKWVGDTVKGKYKYREKYIKYNFCINDNRFRIHSHTWLQKLTNYNYSGYLEVFDLVGNFPFAEPFKFRDNKIYVEPLIIEALALDQYVVPRQFPYSILGQGNTFVRGVQERIICPYADFEMEDDEGDDYYEITSEVQIAKDGTVLLFNNVEIPFKNGQLLSHDIFIRRYDKDKNFRVYIAFRKIHRRDTKEVIYGNSYEQKVYEIKKGEKIRRNDQNPFKFHWTPIRFRSFPRNINGTIITTFKVISLIDAKKLDASTLHQYWPALTPWHDQMGESLEVDYSQMETENHDVTFFEMDEFS